MERRDFEIRAAAPGDLPALLDLYRHLQPDDAEMSEQLARDRFNEMLAHSGMAMFLALSGDHAVSTIPWSSSPTSPAAARPTH